MTREKAPSNRAMNSLIAYCGLDCATCPIHMATLEEDAARKQRMRIEIARLCSEQYGMHLSLQEITDCDGCVLPAGRLFSGCARCEIRACAIGRNCTSCAFCADYACGKLLNHFESDPHAKARLESLRGKT